MRDIEVYTELVGVVRSELIVDKHDILENLMMIVTAITQLRY